MGRPDYKTCKSCGRHASDVGELSHTRLCSECSVGRLVASVVEQKAHSGPIFQHWRRQLTASVGGVLLDDFRESA